jgi:hypothetical protein
MAITLIELSGTLAGLSAPQTARVTVVATHRLIDDGVSPPRIYWPEPRTATPDEDGLWSIEDLPATKGDSGVTPRGVTYKVTVAAGGATETWDVELDAADGASQDLADLDPVVGTVTYGVEAATLANTLDASLGDQLVGMKQPITGAVARTAHSKFAEMYSPQDFGAAGNGTTDDLAVFNTLVANVPEGSTIRLNGKQFGLSAVLLINRRVNFELEGGGFTQTSAGTVDGPLVRVTADGATIREGRILGSETALTWTAGTSRAGVRVEADDVRIEGLYVSGKTYAVQLYDALRSTVDSLTVRGFMTNDLLSPNLNSGLYIYGGGWHSIKSLDTADTGSGSVLVAQSQYNTYLNPRVRDWRDNGIYVSGANNNAIIGGRLVSTVERGTGVKFRGDDNIVQATETVGGIVGMAFSGVGYVGVGEVYNEGSFPYGAGTIDYVGRGNRLVDVTTRDTLGTGIEAQGRPVTLGGDDVFPYECEVLNARIINACSDGDYSANYGLYLRGHYLSVRHSVVSGYGGATFAARVQGTSDGDPAIGMKVENLTIFDSAAFGLQVLYCDDGAIDDNRGASLTAPAFYLFGSQNNRVTGNVGKTDITAGSLEAMELDATSTGNMIDKNDLTTAAWSEANNHIGSNTIDGVVRGPHIPLASRMKYGGFPSA